MKESPQEALRQELEALLNRNPETPDQWVEVLSGLYEKALVEQFLEHRRRAVTAMEDRLREQVASRILAEPSASVKQEEPPVTSSSQAPDVLMPEVKVLPPPEGPPKPQPKAHTQPVHDREELEEKVAAKAAPVAPTPPVQPATGRAGFNLGLNDRISLTRELFGNQQEDLNRVLSQIATMDTYRDAEDFLVNLVKPDYDWSGKEEYEDRLFELVKARFGQGN